MNKIITTISEYDLELHKIILGVNTDKNGNEFVYQPERLNPEDGKAVCDSLNSMETWRERSEEVAPPIE